MEEKKEKEESLTKQLYHFAGSYKYLSILSTILAAISAFVALVPFYYIWAGSDHIACTDRRTWCHYDHNRNVFYASKEDHSWK